RCAVAGLAERYRPDAAGDAAERCYLDGCAGVAKQCLARAAGPGAARGAPCCPGHRFAGGAGREQLPAAADQVLPVGEHLMRHVVRPPSLSYRHRQRGVAVITALLLTTLA